MTGSPFQDLSDEVATLRRAVQALPLEELISAIQESAMAMGDLTVVMMGLPEEPAPDPAPPQPVSDPEDWKCARCGGALSAFPSNGWFHRCSKKYREGT